MGVELYNRTEEIGSLTAENSEVMGWRTGSRWTVDYRTSGG